ncbi:electron transport complex subunit RsxC [Aggregatibacter sp. 2125159857]|uniref:electron transport complex subunit RsxC n=1 Tax=Aggregatibacter sp. 2125159857 TaxID=2820817 RepID=UPI001ADEF9F6|nr:electron transport complex subunit RsxC [Aggregatibacter sp. 2125159857]QTO02269.1 electron transport complex subunit RsxC [Aggregatibacter sp. 2125159857]
MADVLTRFNSGKLWEFDGGIHPPDMKSQSNGTPIRTLPLPDDFYVPVKQHAGRAGNLLVKPGDQVLKGQPLTQGDGLQSLPVHAPTSGTVIDIAPYVAPHPSGLTETCVHIQADGLDQWRPQMPIEDFFTQTREQLIEKIYQAGIAGLGGAVFPTAAKIHSAEKQVKLLIINGAECEPYITCDDRLMRDRADEIIEGVRILRYILRPEKVVIAIEDNKLEAVSALEHALHGANDIEIRVIPTKYPSGAAKQLIQVLTGMEVPSGQRSSSIGVLMQNVGTAFAIKRAVLDDEPLIERVVTLTGDKIPNKGNYWARFGTPISHLLRETGYQYDDRFPVFMGGPMMGVILPDLNAPMTKVANCLLAPDHFEYAPPEPEKSCIRCSACSDACPVKLMPQQLYWFARSENHEKSEEYSLKDCIECGVCAYVCPSHIPLIQYFRQEKAKIWEIKHKAKLAEEAKIRFEQRQARLEREEQERKARSQRAAAARREELAQQKGVDPVAAALERLKAKKAESAENTQIEQKTLIDEKGHIQPDNRDIMAQRKARRLARQAEAVASAEPATDQSAVQISDENPADTDPRKAAIAAALARAKAKKAAQQGETVTSAEPATDQSAVQISDENPAEADPRKAAIAAAIARAKAKKVAQQGENVASAEPATVQSAVQISDENTAETDPRKAAIAAAIARAKAKKAAQQGENVASAEPETTQSAVQISDENPADTDPRKAAIAAAIARAKAKKAAQQGENVASAEPATDQSAVQISDENPADTDPRKAAIAAAIARAKAKKAAQQGETVASTEPATAQSAVQISDENPADTDPRKAAIAAAIARAKAKKAAQQAQQNEQH